KPRGTGAYATATKAAKAKAQGGEQPAAGAAAPKRRGRPAKAATASGLKRGPGRPPKAMGSAASSGGFTDVIEAVRGIERERDQMRSALLKIRDLIAAVE